MIDPDNIRDLYHLASGAMRSLHNGVSSVQSSNIARESIDGFFNGETPTPEAPAEPITPNFDLPEDI